MEGGAREGGGALRSCLSKLTCFSKENGSCGGMKRHNGDVRNRDDVTGCHGNGRIETRQQQRSSELSTVVECDVPQVAMETQRTNQIPQKNDVIDTNGYMMHRPGDMTSSATLVTVSQSEARFASQETVSQSVAQPGDKKKSTKRRSLPLTSSSTQSTGPAYQEAGPACQEARPTYRLDHPISLQDQPTGKLNSQKNPQDPQNLHPCEGELDSKSVEHLGGQRMGSSRKTGDRRRSQPPPLGPMSDCSTSLVDVNPPSVPKEGGDRRRSHPLERIPPPSILSCSSLSSSSSYTSSVTLNTELVAIKLNPDRNLGITVIGQEGREGDLGIFVGLVKPKGPAQATGKLSPGDWILEVNGIDVGPMTNDEALATLRKETRAGSVVSLLVAKYRDYRKEGIFADVMWCFDDDQSDMTSESSSQSTCDWELPTDFPKQISNRILQKSLTSAVFAGANPMLPMLQQRRQKKPQLQKSRRNTQQLQLKQQQQQQLLHIAQRNASRASLQTNEGRGPLRERQLQEGSGISASQLQVRQQMEIMNAQAEYRQTRRNKISTDVNGIPTTRKYPQLTPDSMQEYSSRHGIPDGQRAGFPDSSSIDSHDEEYPQDLPASNGYFPVIPANNGYFPNMSKNNGYFQEHSKNTLYTSPSSMLLGNRDHTDSDTSTSDVEEAFPGSDLVDWIQTSVQGFSDRGKAIQYASGLFGAGYISRFGGTTGGNGNGGTFSECALYRIVKQWNGTQTSYVL